MSRVEQVGGASRSHDQDRTMLFDPPGSTPASRLALGLGRSEASMNSLSRATKDLRRERLAKVSFILALLYLVLLVWNALTVSHSLWLVWATMALRLMFVSMLSILLFSPLELSRTHTKAIELTLFGGLTIILSLAQYFASLMFVRQDDPLLLIAFQKNGVLQMITLMLLYGTVIPNQPKPAAKLLFAMAALPSISYILLIINPECAHLYERLSSAEQIGSNILFLFIGMLVSVFSAWTVNNLRTELHEARKLGQYRLGKKIGTGGMGEVYLAEHDFLKRPCALKLIKSEALSSPVALARFELEVQSAAQLSHPNTIEIYDYGHAEDGTFYYVMEFLQGLTLADLVIRFGPLPFGRAIYLFRQVCAGLAEAHAMGLIHRDLKPANIFIAVRGGETDVAKVLDFGLVKNSRETESPALTAEQSVSGTPQFMAPEQASGKRDIDARVDVYAIGCVLYYALTGRPPFTQSSAFEVMIAHVRDTVEPPSVHRPDLPKDLEAVVMRCLMKDPRDRYVDVRVLSRALASCESAGSWDADAADRWWAAASRELRSELVSTTQTDDQTQVG